MSKKALKVAMLLGLIALVILTAGVVMAAEKGKTQLPEYVGSEACLGCHSDTYLSWESSGHANMVNPIESLSDLPAPLSSTTPELQAELQKADYIVAGQRFVARDKVTGDMKYLNVVFQNGQYKAYKGGSSWSANTGCAGCHSVNWDQPSKSFTEPGIGCEACHGPGRDHILGKGNPDKIVVNNASDVCARCHVGGAKMPDGTSWPVGYKPNMKLSEIKDYKIPVLSSENGVPVSNHYRIWPYYEASKHNQAVEDLETSDHVADRCYACHADEAFKAVKLEGKTWTKPKGEEVTPMSCVTCHDPHNSTNEYQLRLEPAALCVTCHTGDIDPKKGLTAGKEAHHPNEEFFAGFGAIGIATTPSIHNEEVGVTCVSCHMTEGNHMFKVITPEQVLAEGKDRVDSCTACHGDASDVRNAYLNVWQDTTTAKLATLNADIATVQAALKANPNALNADLKAKFDIAFTNVSLVKADGSNGAHNFSYAMKILTDAQKKMKEVKAGLGK